MSILDIILSLILAAALLHGLFKGFTGQVIAIVAILAGTWAALKFTNVVCNFIQPLLGAPVSFLKVLVFILMLVLVILLFKLIGKLIKASINFVTLGWLDRLLGAVFGLLKAAIVLGILAVLFTSVNNTFNFVSEETLSASPVFASLRNVSLTILPYLKNLLS
ncbi:MAG: CvpA family protein [Candidatus Cryptobacteroides sp.]